MIRRKRTGTTLIGTAVLLLTAAAQAQVYKVTDEEGNVSFTDRPPNEDSGATVERIQIKGVNSAEPPPVITAPVNREPKKEKIDYNTEITSPADGTTIPMGGGNFGVGARISPPLSPGEKLQLKLDGAALGEPQISATWQLNNVFRGEHNITIDRVSAGGKVLHSSMPITVYVLRPGLRR